MDIKTLLQYAVRAPSTHNSQPWLFKIKENSCQIFADPNYNLAEADPKGRDLYISLGCCLENFILAAKHFRIFKDISILQEEVRLPIGSRTSRPIAEIFFQETADRNPDSRYADLCQAIMQRFNARGVFKKNPVEKIFIEKFYYILDSEYDHVNVRVSFVEDKEKVSKLAGFTRQGIRTAYRNKAFRKEMSGWVNNAVSKKTKGISSQALRMPFFISFVFPKLVKYFDVGKMLGKINQRSICSAPVMAVLEAREDNPKNWINAGRVGERLMLECFARGLKTSIFAAAIEMGFGNEVQKVMESDFKPQLLIALGYLDTPQKPTPREEIEKKLI